MIKTYRSVSRHDTKLVSVVGIDAIKEEIINRIKSEYPIVEYPKWIIIDDSGSVLYNDVNLPIDFLEHHIKHCIEMKHFYFECICKAETEFSN